MGMFDATSVSPMTPPIAAPQPSTQTVPPDQADFIRRYIEAARAHGRANPGSLLNLLTGRQTDADVAAATAAAPSAWQQFQAGQAGTQNAQLGTASNIAQTGAMAGVPIDPNNIPAATGDLTKAYMGMYGMGGNAGGDPSASPIEQQRAFYNRLGTMFSRNPATAPIATEFFKLRDQGLPNGVAVLPNGRAVDSVSSQPVSGSFGQVNASQAAPTKAMETGYTEAAASHQAGLDRTTTAMGNVDKNRYDTLSGYDTTSGQPKLVSKADFANGQSSAFAPGENPYVAKHQAEIEASQKDAAEANNTLIQLKTLQAAAQGIHTGQWGDNIQSIRRGLASLGLSDPSMMGAATKGDVVNQIGLEVAALRAKASSGGRTALGTLNAFRSVKPGLLSTDPAAQIKTLLPQYQRQVDYGNFVGKYYGDGKNWNKLDAPSAFAKENPDQKYVDAAGLGHAQANPADYGAPAGAQQIGWHAGLPVFSVNGKKFLGHR